MQHKNCVVCCIHHKNLLEWCGLIFVGVYEGLTLIFALQTSTLIYKQMGHIDPNPQRIFLPTNVKI